MVAAEVRRPLARHRVAPLTEGQLGDVVGRRNQLRIVLGSAATGADLLHALLAEAEHALGTFTLLTPPTRSGFLDALTGGERGAQHRVVYADVTGVRPETVVEELGLAASLLPGGGVTRSAVLHVDAGALELWLRILDPAQAAPAADSVVACRRLDKIGLERWSHNQHGRFSDSADREKLLAVTSGWPLLVDTVAAHIATGAGTTEALATVRSALDNDLGPRLLDTTGLVNSVLHPAYSALVSIGRDLLVDVPDTDVETELRPHHSRPSVVVAALLAAGALTRNRDDGMLSLEPVLATQWELRRS